MAILNTLPVAFTIALEPADISRNQQGMAQTRQPTAPSRKTRAHKTCYYRMTTS